MEERLTCICTSLKLILMLDSIVNAVRHCLNHYISAPDVSNYGDRRMILFQTCHLDLSFGPSLYIDESEYKPLSYFITKRNSRYNLAVTQETFAITVLQKDQIGESRIIADVQHAIDDLITASKLFKWLRCVTMSSAQLHAECSLPCCWCH